MYTPLKMIQFTLFLDNHSLELMTERAEALRPRLRRLSSFEDVKFGATESEQPGLHRPSSAPDLAKKIKVSFMLFQLTSSEY